MLPKGSLLSSKINSINIFYFCYINLALTRWRALDIGILCIMEALSFLYKIILINMLIINNDLIIISMANNSHSDYNLFLLDFLHSSPISIFHNKSDKRRVEIAEGNGKMMIIRVSGWIYNN